MEPAASNPNQLKLDLWPNGGEPFDMRCLLNAFEAIEKQRYEPAIRMVSRVEYDRRRDDLLRRGLL